MQARKRTISDQPWFCQNQVYAWLGYKQLFNRVLLEFTEEVVRIKRVRVRGVQLSAEDAQLVAEADARDARNARMNAIFPWVDEADTEEEEGEYEDLYPILH